MFDMRLTNPLLPSLKCHRRGTVGAFWGTFHNIVVSPFSAFEIMGPDGESSGAT